MSIPFAFRPGSQSIVQTKAGSKMRILYHVAEKAALLNPDDDETAVIREEIVNDGEEDIQAKIQSNYEASLLKNIVARYNITGDPSLVNRFQPLDPEIHKALNSVPMDSADAAQFMKDNHDKIVKSTGLPENFTNEDLQNFIKQEVERQTSKKQEEKSSVETKSEPQKEETTKTETKEVNTNGNK